MTVDHIRPVSEFVKAGETRPAVISALNNLRPMWKFDNASKHKRDAPSVPDYTEPNPSPRGETHHLAKLNPQKVSEIRRRLASPKYGDITRIAREFGIHVSTVKMVMRGETWKDVT